MFGKYYIYCKERDQFWNQNRFGYTSDHKLAGRFSKKATDGILESANLVREEEIAVPESEIFTFLQTREKIQREYKKENGYSKHLQSGT